MVFFKQDVRTLLILSILTPLNHYQNKIIYKLYETNNLQFNYLYLYINYITI